MRTLVPTIILATFLALCTAACRDRCDLDNALPVEPVRTLKLLIKDSATGELLVGSGRRYHPDSIFYSRGSGGGLFEKVQTDPSGADSAILIRHLGTSTGLDCDGTAYPRYAGNLDSVLLRLDAMDTDTLVVDAASSGDVLLYYNGRLLLTTPYGDNSLQAVEARK